MVDEISTLEEVVDPEMRDLGIGEDANIGASSVDYQGIRAYGDAGRMLPQEADLRRQFARKPEVVAIQMGHEITAGQRDDRKVIFGSANVRFVPEHYKIGVSTFQCIELRWRLVC